MEEMKISEGIQATIDLLESVHIPMKEFETQGVLMMTAIKNLKIIKEATVRAENAAESEGPVSSEPEITIEAEAVPCTE